MPQQRVTKALLNYPTITFVVRMAIRTLGSVCVTLLVSRGAVRYDFSLIDHVHILSQVKAAFDSLTQVPAQYLS